MTYLENIESKELIGFRDYLKTPLEVMKEYADVKKQAAKMANQNRDQYRKMKEPILQKINALIRGPHVK